MAYNSLFIHTIIINQNESIEWDVEWISLQGSSDWSLALVQTTLTLASPVNSATSLINSQSQLLKFVYFDLMCCLTNLLPECNRSSLGIKLMASCTIMSTCYSSPFYSTLSWKYSDRMCPALAIFIFLACMLIFKRCYSIHDLINLQSLNPCPKYSWFK